jgi:uncharacterized protein YerC
MAKPKKDLTNLRPLAVSEIPIEILKDILTESEIIMLKNRWLIIQCLDNGLSIRKTAAKVKVGTDTVVRVSKMFEKKTIKNYFGKTGDRQFKTQTPWIFGKK